LEADGKRCQEMQEKVEQRTWSMSHRDKDDIHGVLEKSGSENGRCTHAGSSKTLTNEA
jgi:hypothetical protein